MTQNTVGMERCLKSCCGACTAQAKWAAYFFGQPEDCCCHGLVTPATWWFVQRQMALCYLEPLLKLCIWNPKLADWFIFHYIIPVDTTNALQNCLQILPAESPALSVSILLNICCLCNTFIRTETGWLCGYFKKHFKAPINSLIKRLCMWKIELQPRRFGLGCGMGHVPVVQWRKGEIKAVDECVGALKL